MINRIMKWLTLAYILSAIFSAEARANTITAADCNTSSVQSAINSAASGDTVLIPAGTCTWTSGVTISGKGIVVKGTGSARIIAYSVTSSALPLTIRPISITISPNNVAGTLPSLNIGQTLQLIELGVWANFLQGTVTSYNQSTGALSMNITSAGGTCGTNTGGGLVSNCKRWMLSNSPSVSETILTNNATSGGAMFNVTEDTSVHTSISGIHFAKGSGTISHIQVNRNGTSGQAVLIQNNLFENASPEIIDSNSNRGVASNNSFLGVPYTAVGSGIRVRDSSGNLAYSWTSPSTMGTADTTGQNNFYIETNDWEALGQVTDLGGNSRVVFRYNFLNNAFGTSHGPDTEPYGMRHAEFYNNKLVWQSYTDGTTVNPGFGGWLIRGGTIVFTANDIPSLNGQDWGTKADVQLQIENLNRNAGPNPCWGINTTGGARYHDPRQIGFGYVTGSGTDGLGRTNDSVTYVGDSEPVYIWGNTRGGSPYSPISVFVASYPGSQSDSCSGTADSPNNYAAPNRDYFNGSTAKPGYTPYTYPHPLSLGSGSGTKPAPPTGLTAIVN